MHILCTDEYFGFTVNETFCEKAGKFSFAFRKLFAKFRIFSRKLMKQKQCKKMRNFAEIIFTKCEIRKFHEKKLIAQKNCAILCSERSIIEVLLNYIFLNFYKCLMKRIWFPSLSFWASVRPRTFTQIQLAMSQQIQERIF